jgi:hypothetical protein
MNRLVRAAMVVSGGLLMCAAQSAAPAGDTAQITFVKGYDKGYGIGGQSDQEYSLLWESGCRGTRLMAVFRALDGGEKTKSVAAGSRMTIAALAERRSLLGLKTCENNVTFTPEAGHHYRFTQVAKVAKTCHIEVVDLADNAPPPDLAYDRAPKCGNR